ncbi:MAG TPA: hypothetical protein VFJ57_11740 [Solirubrobacterales bacterium]|nr:hypothetical protein [Solirubrobacterales bacterium]
MPAGEPSGKPWKPSFRAEDLALFAEKARDLDAEFLDREGNSMSPGEWFEAKADPDYLVVAFDPVGPLGILTTWIGVHYEGDRGWERVIFGTQVIYLDQEKMARAIVGAVGPGKRPPPSDPDKSFDILRIDAPDIGEILQRFGWRTLPDAETGHGWIVDGFKERLLEDPLT